MNRRTRSKAKINDNNVNKRKKVQIKSEFAKSNSKKKSKNENLKKKLEIKVNLTPKKKVMQEPSNSPILKKKKPINSKLNFTSKNLKQDLFVNDLTVDKEDDIYFLKRENITLSKRLELTNTENKNNKERLKELESDLLFSKEYKREIKSKDKKLNEITKELEELKEKLHYSKRFDVNSEVSDYSSSSDEDEKESKNKKEVKEVNEFINDESESESEVEDSEVEHSEVEYEEKDKSEKILRKEDVDSIEEYPQAGSNCVSLTLFNKISKSDEKFIKHCLLVDIRGVYYTYKIEDTSIIENEKFYKFKNIILNKSDEIKDGFKIVKTANTHFSVCQEEPDNYKTKEPFVYKTLKEIKEFYECSQAVVIDIYNWYELTCVLIGNEQCVEKLYLKFKPTNINVFDSVEVRFVKRYINQKGYSQFYLAPYGSISKIGNLNILRKISSREDIAKIPDGLPFIVKGKISKINYFKIDFRNKDNLRYFATALLEVKGEEQPYKFSIVNECFLKIFEKTINDEFNYFDINKQKSILNKECKINIKGSFVKKGQYVNLIGFNKHICNFIENGSTQQTLDDLEETRTAMG